MKNINTSTWDEVSFQPLLIYRLILNVIIILHHQHLYLFIPPDKPSLVLNICSQINRDLSLSFNHNTTSDISPVLFNLLSSRLNQDQVWPFYYTYICYLLVAKPYLAASPQSQRPLGDMSDISTVHSQRKKWVFFCLMSVKGRSADGEAEEQREHRVHQTLSTTRSYSHTWTHSLTSSLVSREIPDHVALLLVLWRMPLNFPLWSGRFHRHVGKIPAVVLVSLNQIQMWFKILSNNAN